MTKRSQCLRKLILCGLSVNISMVSHCQLSIGHIHFNNTALLHLKEEESTGMYVCMYVHTEGTSVQYTLATGRRKVHACMYIHTHVNTVAMCTLLPYFAHGIQF